MVESFGGGDGVQGKYFHVLPFAVIFLMVLTVVSLLRVSAQPRPAARRGVLGGTSAGALLAKASAPPRPAPLSVWRVWRDFCGFAS